MNEPMRVRNVIEQLQRFDQDARCQVEIRAENPPAAPTDEEWLNFRASLLELREQNEHGIRYIVFSN